MVDRQDIDALLVSALYGELTPADEARLAAHLESHPADRTVLADLTHTRQAVRDSRILAVQLEPPQSISALLIQEAARRAPRKVVSEDEKVGWFQRFTRAFMAHPAMAAAAMLVVVVGVAGTLQMRKGDQFTETSRPAPTAPSLDEGVAADRQRNAGPSVDQQNLETAQVVVAGDAGTATASARGDTLSVNGKLDGKADSYGVDLAPGGQVKAGDGVADPKPAVTDDKVAKEQPTPRAGLEQEKAKLARAERDHAAHEPAPRGIIVHGSDSPQPMDFERDTPAPEPAHETVDRSLAEGRTPGVAPTTTAPGTGAAGGGAQGAPGAGTSAGTAPSRPAPRPADAAPPAAAPRNTAPADNRRLQDKTTSVDEKNDKQNEKQAENLLQWARTVHTRVVDSVKQNNCGNAAQLALQIYRSAPDYYRDNVASDRSLKSCMAYINTEHDKEVERVRAAKARAVQTNDSAAPAQTQKQR